MLMRLRNDNNVARVKLKRIETSICPIINKKLSTPIFGQPMGEVEYLHETTFRTQHPGVFFFNQANLSFMSFKCCEGVKNGH